MVIETPPDFRIVEDYDIESITGNSITVTIDPSIGDTISISDAQIAIYVAPRTSQADKSQVNPAETTTINATHVFAVRKRERQIMNMTVEQQFEWQKTFKEMGNKMH